MWRAIKEGSLPELDPDVSADHYELAEYLLAAQSYRHYEISNWAIAGRDCRHILEPGYPNGHRHLLAGPYLVYSLYGLGEDLSRLLLWTPLHVESQFHNELAGRQTLITNKGLLHAADKLYFDKSDNKPKRGALMEKNSPGTLLRFINIVQQLDLTYDLYSMSGEEILALLPPEFDKWKGSP